MPSNRIIIKIAALLFITAYPTVGKSTALDCAKIKEPDMRLICYDDIFKTKSENISIPETRGLWSVRVETSKIDDSKNVFLSLQSTEPVIGRYGEKENMRLWIACRENKTSLWIIFGGHFMSDLHGGHVTYRVDTKKANRKRFRESNDNEALGLWDGGSSIPFIKQLFEGKRLYVSAVPFSESTVEGEFQIEGISEAIKPLREACNW